MANPTRAVVAPVVAVSQAVSRAERFVRGDEHSDEEPVFLTSFVHCCTSQTPGSRGAGGAGTLRTPGCPSHLVVAPDRLFRPPFLGSVLQVLLALRNLREGVRKASAHQTPGVVDVRIGVCLEAPSEINEPSTGA